MKHAIQGLEQLQRKLKRLPPKVERQFLRRALTKGATPVVKAARVAAPVRTGALMLAITKKVKAYSTGKTIAVIGAKRSVETTVNGRRHVPANIYHLVEQGHGGPHPAPPHPTLGPAAEQSKTKAQDAIQKSLAKDIEKEALR